MKREEGHIDIIDLLIRIYLYLKKRILFLLIFGLIGAIAGKLYFEYIFEPYYETTMIGNSKTISNTSIVKMVEILNGNNEKKDYEAIAKSLNIDTKTARKIVHISAATVEEEVSINTPNIPEYSHNNFSVTLQIYDKGIIETVSKGLLDYLSGNNTVINEKNQFVKSYYDSILVEIDNEVKQLTKFQDLIINDIQNKNNSIIDLGYFPSNEKIDLYFQKAELIKLNLNYNAVNLIKDFTPPRQIKKGEKGELVFLFFSFFFLGIILLALFEFHRKAVSQDR